MASLNKLMLIGNVGKDPEVKVLQNSSIANFSLATTSSWKDKNTGEKKEETEWHRVVVYGKLVDIVEKYIKSGDKLYLEGRLKSRKWIDKAGVERLTTEVICEQITMLGGKSNSTVKDNKPKDFIDNNRFANNSNDDVPF